MNGKMGGASSKKVEINGTRQGQCRLHDQNYGEDAFDEDEENCQKVVSSSAAGMCPLQRRATEASTVKFPPFTSP